MGLCLVGVGMTPFIAIGGVSNITGGLASNSFRLTKIVNMEFPNG